MAQFRFSSSVVLENIMYVCEHFQQHVTPGNTRTTSQHHLMARSKEIISLRGGLNASKYMIIQTQDSTKMSRAEDEIFIRLLCYYKCKVESNTDHICERSCVALCSS